MQTRAFFITLCCAFVSFTCFAQEETAQPSSSGIIPSVEISNVDGTKLNVRSLFETGQPVIIAFWATWCKPCKDELDNIAEVYDLWQEETSVKLVAVSIDDSRSAHRVPLIANTGEWPFQILQDPNQDLKRAMNVNNIPHTFLLNPDGEIVWEHNAYAEGDEEELYERLKGLVLVGNN